LVTFFYAFTDFCLLLWIGLPVFGGSSKAEGSDNIFQDLSLDGLRIEAVQEILLRIVTSLREE